MRKLLFASQRRGVGQSATALNFAAAGGLSGSRTLLIAADPESDLAARLRLEGHADQATLNDVGLADFGRLYRNVLPNLDLLTPYEKGRTAPGQLDEVVAKFGHGWFDKYAWCLIDAPPLGDRPSAALLKAADELIFVFAPDVASAELMPSFHDFMHKTEAANKNAMVRGVLLTRAKPDATDEHENDVRQQLGRKALPLTIPFDAAQLKAEDAGKPIVFADPGSPAAQMWKELAEALGVARSGSAILKAPTKSGAFPKSDPLKTTPAPASPPSLTQTPPPSRPAPRRPLAANMSGEFKVDPALLDSVLGKDSEPVGLPDVPSAPRKRPPPPRRNEARSFLDLEPADSPPSGLEGDRPGGGRVPQLEEHISAYRPAAPSRPAPAPRAPTAPPPPISMPASKPSSRVGVGSSAQLQVRGQAAAAPPQRDAVAVALWWIIGVVLFVAAGLGVSFLGMKAADAGQLHVFVATLVGFGVTLLIVVGGIMAFRRR